MKILLTDGSHMNTLAIMRQTFDCFIHAGPRKNGQEIDIIHHKKSAPAYSRYCRNLIISPEITDIEGYFAFLLSHVKNNRYDILIPVGALASYICSKYYDQLSFYVRIEITEFKYFDIAINKTLTYKFCKKHGILYPKTYHIIPEIEYPVIIKAAGEVKGKFPVKYVNNKSEFYQEFTLIKWRYPHLQWDDLIIQDYIKGEPYGFFCLYQNGVLKRAICQRRIREYPATGGHATTAETIYDPKLIELGKEVFDKLNWHGVGMVEYLKIGDDYYLIEINPKFWTAIELHILAGMDFPKYLLQMGDRKLDYFYTSRKERFVWLFAPEGELYRLFQRPGDIFRVIKDLFRSKTDLHLDDIKPTVIQFLYWIIWIFKKKK